MLGVHAIDDCCEQINGFVLEVVSVSPAVEKFVLMSHASLEKSSERSLYII